jgi:hypothetical protein
MMTYAVDAVDQRARGRLLWNDSSWSLCIGAGTSLGLMPSWRELAYEVLNRAAESELDIATFDRLVASTGWQFDAWIQTALNVWRESGRSEAEFGAVLEEILYKRLREAARTDGLEQNLVYAFYQADLLRRAEQQAVLDFFTNRFPAASVVQLASVLARSLREGRPPRAVLTFNYDTVLDTLIRTSEIIENRTISKAAAFRRITRPAPPSVASKIPIYHLHGCLPPRAPADGDRGITRKHSADGIVAPETTYLRLAASNAAWAQTTFLYHAQGDNLILIGHSFSDPNVRRWLLWATDVGGRPNALRHIWLTRRPASKEDEKILIHSVHHLGVLIAWIDDWSEVGAALENLVALGSGRSAEQPPNSP